MVGRRVRVWHIQALHVLVNSGKPIVSLPPSPSPADATGQSRKRTVLQGTITSLKLIQQIVGLAPIPGLQSLFGVVLNISELVDVSFGTTFISCKILTLSIQEYVCRRRCSR